MKKRKKVKFEYISDKELINMIVEERNTFYKMIDFMAEYIDRVDTKHNHCAGFLCTVATTCYPEEERKKICCNCIKIWARKEAEK